VADEVCKKASGNDNSSLEELIGVDLVELVKDYDKNKTVKQLLIENGMTEKQINDYLEGIKEFLRMSATRHLSFDYKMIAEFYAHQPKEVQDLFEKSALVIIDFNKAIENGFVKMSQRLSDIMGDEDEE
jgi:hypothetical protein